MFNKYGNAKIVRASASIHGISVGANLSQIKRASKKLSEINLDPEKCVYTRNRAVSALEIHGPNQNWDAFEYDELRDKYSTFIGNPISVDHVGTDVIGTVLDSEFIAIPDIKEELDIPTLPYEDTVIVLGEKCRKDTVYGKVLEYAQANRLVKNSDPKMIVQSVAKTMSSNAGWVENIWAIEKEAAESYNPGMVEAILKNHITDSSMGASVGECICSVCGNVATGELPEHEDFCDCIRLYKGTSFPISGEVVIPFEINRQISFFEDSLILPFSFGGKAGGEGADKDAKLLEVFARKNKKTANKKAYMEPSPGIRDFPAGTGYGVSPSVYYLIGDIPENVEENREEFNQNRIDFSEESQEKGSASGQYPEGTFIKVDVGEEKKDAIVVEEWEDHLVVAVDDYEDPLEVDFEDVVEVISYPDEMSYERKMAVEDINDWEMTPEQRAG